MSAGNILKLTTEPPLASQRPAVNFLFHTLARISGQSAIGVLLAGMGEDGAGGLVDMKEGRVFTIAEDESPAVVYGMPVATCVMTA